MSSQSCFYLIVIRPMYFKLGIVIFALSFPTNLSISHRSWLAHSLVRLKFVENFLDWNFLLALLAIRNTVIRRTGVSPDFLTNQFDPVCVSDLLGVFGLHSVIQHVALVCHR